jgi:hypothetical protein
MTDAATQTGWDEARVSAAAPCPALAFASCSGRPGATAGALRAGTDPHPRRPARRRFACPDLGESERRGPPPRSARGDPRDPPGLGPVRTRPPRHGMPAITAGTTRTGRSTTRAVLPKPCQMRTVTPLSVRNDSKSFPERTVVPLLRQEAPTMEYLVTMTTHVPDGT